jgi:hypothetical protein
LGGRTIEELKAAMTVPEFRCWMKFYELFPFDDLHVYHRPAAMIASAFGGKYNDRLEFLAPEPIPDGMSKADWTTLKAFGINPKG